MQIYDQDGITLHHGLCEQILPALEVRADIIVTDLPYSARTHSGARTNKRGLEGTSPVDFPSMTLDEVKNVLALASGQLESGWVIAFCDWLYCGALATTPPANLKWVRMGIWAKNNPMPQLTGDRPAMGFEALAILHTPGRMSWNGGGKSAVLTANVEPATHHPTQKPLRLMKQLLTLFAHPGQLVLDPCMGSGSTILAAKQLGCRAVGIEKEERYCRSAVKRLRQRYLF